MMKISAVVIAFNEEKHIGRCLASLQNVADEIVLVDSYSTDRTKEIGIECEARVLQRRFDGYSNQKNFANAQATHEIILSLDADECLSDQLKASILAAKNGWACDAYWMNRLNNFCGQWIKHGTWYPDKKLRLWDKRLGQWQGEIHERVVMQPGAKEGLLKGDLLHYTVESASAYRQQLDKFTDMDAMEMYRQGKRHNAGVAYGKTAFAFARSYLLRLGMLDGYNGLRVAYFNALNVWMKHSKLKRLDKPDCCA